MRKQEHYSQLKKMNSNLHLIILLLNFIFGTSCSNKNLSKNCIPCTQPPKKTIESNNLNIMKKPHCTPCTTPIKEENNYIVTPGTLPHSNFP